MNFLMTRRKLLALGVVAVLSGCNSAEPEEKLAEPKPYSVQSVKVELAQDATLKGRFAEDAELRKTAIDKLQATVDERLKAIPGGARAGHVTVTLTHMRLKAAGSRSFGAINDMSANIVVKGSNGAVLQDGSGVAYSDHAKNTAVVVNAVPVGLLINLARNAGHSENGKDLDKLVLGMTAEIETWFKQ